MHLRYIASARLPTEKAHGIQIVSMCDAFASHGITVELVVPARNNPGKKVDDIFDYYDIPQTFSVRALPLFDPTRYATVLGKIAFALLPRLFARAARRDARENPADLYYIRDEHTFLSFATSGLPTIFEIHTMMNRPERFREAFMSAIAIVAITRGLRDELISCGVPAEKIIVAPDGVDLKRFSSAGLRDDARHTLHIPIDTRIALYTGQLFPWKGVDTLIEAAAHLPNGMEVLVVGGGAGRANELKKKAVHINARVRFVGQVPHAKIPLYLQAADVTVIPTSAREKIGRDHTSPLKLFEAMAMGKAIVASDVPSLREILDPTTAVFFTPDDPHALREALISLLRDPLRATKLGQTAKDKIASYDWHARAGYIMSYVRRLDHTL